MRARLTAAALVAGVAVTLTACSTSSGDAASGSNRPAPYPSKAAATAASTAPAAQSGIERVLVTAHDLGRGFVRAQPDAPASLPCTPNDPPVDDQVHHVNKSDAVFVNDLGGVQVSEQVYAYGSVADARRHESIDEHGLACARGRFGTTPVTVTGPDDLHGRLGDYSDTAEAWGIKTARFSGAMIAVRIHAVMVQFAIVAETGSTANVDARHIVEVGVRKVLTAATTQR